MGLREFLIVKGPRIDILLVSPDDSWLIWTALFRLVELGKAEDGLDPVGVPVYLRFEDNNWSYSLDSEILYLKRVPIFELVERRYFETGVVSGQYNPQFEKGTVWRFD